MHMHPPQSFGPAIQPYPQWQPPQMMSQPPATNYVYSKQHDSRIQGTYVVDPLINVPESMLPKIKHHKERKNVYLKTHDGDIRADVYLVGPGRTAPGPQGMPQRWPTTLELKSHDGDIDLKMVRPSLVDKGVQRLTYHVL